MTESNTDVICVKGRSRDGSVTKFFKRSSGIDLNGYKFIRTVQPKDPQGFAFDEYVHAEDYDTYLKMYKEAGIL